MSAKSTQIPDTALTVKTQDSPLVGGVFTHESKASKARNGTFLVLAQWPAVTSKGGTLVHGQGLCYCQRIGKKGKPIGPVVEVRAFDLVRGYDWSVAAEKEVAQAG